MYLTELPEALAEALIGLIGQAYWEALSTVAAFQTPPEPSDAEIVADATIAGPTFREQLVRARRGQGVFRSNVLLRETFCRVTRVDEPRHLKASHIKPWREASDAERLDGANGLLLSPHIDHLFDEGCRSAEHIFGNALGDPVADELLRALRAAGVAGLTRTEISVEVFGRNRQSHQITRGLTLLAEAGLAHCRMDYLTVRPTERWFAGPKNEIHE